MRLCAVSEPPHSVHGSPGVFRSPLVSPLTGAQLAHHRDASRSLEDNVLTPADGPPGRSQPKCRSPVTLRSAGFEQKLGVHTRGGGVAALLRQ
jgi:hypothetical protein